MDFGSPSILSSGLKASTSSLDFGSADFQLPVTDGFGQPSFSIQTKDTTDSFFSPDDTGSQGTYSSVLNGFGNELREPPPLPSSSNSSQSITTRTFDGHPIVIRKRAKVSKSARQTLETRSSQGMANLLDVSVSKMVDNLKKRGEERSNAENTHTPALSNSRDSSLWVDRYKPGRFTDLAGNERVARDALTWVKQWDFCVFGRRKVKSLKRSREDTEKDRLEQDEYHRPREKECVLLLSGPPGLGKTTLAHIVAKHAGYDVMEINASDARSGHEVDDRIKPALESGSAVGSKKPVLLVLDEIDGATGSGDNAATFISRLLNLIQEKPRKKRKAGQKPDPKRPILRPIICVCNDANAASLAKLRPYAYHIRFYRPADIHTVTRLRQICELEGLRADSRALGALVGVAKGDLRGCINTLQYIRSRHSEVTEQIVRGATVGMKENESSLITTMNSIFNPISRRRAKELALTEERESRYVSRLVQEIDTTGKESSIAIACFAQYITRRQHDAHLTRFEQACEWLTTFDSMSSHMYTDGDFAILAYLPYTLVPFHPLFQERGTSTVEKNSDDWDNLQATRANEEIYKSLIKCIRSASSANGGDFRNFVTTPNLQLEFAPYLNRIISPPLRPINQQVVKAGERELLSRLVNLMAGLELRFLQEKTEDGTLTYRLDPPIDVFVTYDGKRASDIAVSRYAFRHLVACEIDAKLGIGRFDVPLSPTRAKLGKTAMSASEDQNMQPPSKMARVGEQKTQKAAVDFFGRPIVTKLGEKPKKNREPYSRAALKAERKGFTIAYKFLEGNSAAVRKPIKTEAFF